MTKNNISYHHFSPILMKSQVGKSTIISLKIGDFTPLQKEIREGTFPFDVKNIPVLSKYSNMRVVRGCDIAEGSDRSIRSSMTVLNFSVALVIAHLEHLFYYCIKQREITDKPFTIFSQLGLFFDNPPRGDFYIEAKSRLDPSRNKKAKDFYWNTLMQYLEKEAPKTSFSSSEFISFLLKNSQYLKYFVLKSLQMYYNSKNVGHEKIEPEEQRIIDLMNSQEEADKIKEIEDIKELFRAFSKILHTKFNLYDNSNGKSINKLCFTGTSILDRKIPAPTFYTNGVYWAMIYSSTNLCIKNQFLPKKEISDSEGKKKSSELIFGLSREQEIISKNFEIVKELLTFLKHQESSTASIEELKAANEKTKECLKRLQNEECESTKKINEKLNKLSNEDMIRDKILNSNPIEFILNSSCSKCNEKKTTLVQRITSCGCTFDICKYCFLGEMKDNLCPKCQAPLKPQAVHLLTHGLCIECKKHLEILPCGHYIDRLCLREKMLAAVKQQQGFDHIRCKEDNVPIPYELLVKVGEDLITELSIY